MPDSILLVDDSELIRHAVRSWIEQNGGWWVCGEAENGKIAVQKVEELHPDIVILDLEMPVMNGLEAARRIAVVAPNTVMLMFTMHGCKQLLDDARAAGIKQVLSKSSSEDLLASLRNISAAPAA